METIGQRIFRLRTKAGFTQLQLAKKVGVSRVAVTKWESDQTENLKLKNLIKLCDVFKISAEYLINGEERDGESKLTTLVTKKESEAEDLADRLRDLDEDDFLITKNVVNHLENKKLRKKRRKD